jgi:hypothetical protein
LLNVRPSSLDVVWVHSKFNSFPDETIRVSCFSMSRLALGFACYSADLRDAEHSTPSSPFSLANDVIGRGALWVALPRHPTDLSWAVEGRRLGSLFPGFAGLVFASEDRLELPGCGG